VNNRASTAAIHTRLFEFDQRHAIVESFLFDIASARFDSPRMRGFGEQGA
jgi:hypothetical protein